METGGKGKNKLDIIKTKTKKKAEKKAEKKAKKEAEKKTKKKSGRTCNIFFCWSFRPSKAVRYNDADDSDENDATAQTNIAEEILDTTQKNRDRKQDCRAIEDTSGKHVVDEEIAERASSKRLSSYDNISNSENFQQQPPTRIDVVPSLLSEEKKREMVPIHAQIEYNSMKQQDSMVRQEQPEKYKGRKSKDVPTQKRVEPVVHNNREEEVLVISQETFKGHERRKYENMPPQKQDSVIEGMKTENEPDEKEPIPNYMKPENDPAIEKVNDMAKRKKSTDTPKKTGYPLETEPVNDQEEGQVSSPIEAVAQVPYEKDAAATANEKKNAIVKRNKSKDAPEEISKLKRINARHRPIVGLQNLGNTCFFNAVMQNINQSSLLYDLLKEQKFDRLHLTGSMVKFYRMVSGSSSTITPSEVLRNVCIRSPRFGGGKQQDSHELLRHLLDGLRNEERELSGNPNNRKTLTKVDKVFGGHFMTVYTCKACKTPYHVCEPLLDMSLPIAFDDLQNDEESSINEEDDETTGDNVQYQKAVKYMMTPLAIKQKKDAQNNHNEYVLDAEVHQLSKSQRKRRNKKAKVQHSETKKSRRDGRSILDCLDAFTRTEHIADEYLCMACHENRVKKGATDYQMTSAKKRTLIYNPPALLTLHLKRFEQTEYGFVKCNDMISFEDMIDIGPYCSSWCMRNEENETSIWYSLYGLVVHGGGLDGGHYVAYVKLRETEDNVRRFIQESYLDRDQLTEETLTDMMEQQMHLMHDRIKRKETETLQPKPVKGTWFYISDSHCSQVQKEEVRRQEAYLLFYERREDKKSICYKRSTGNTETSV